MVGLNQRFLDAVQHQSVLLDSRREARSFSGRQAATVDRCSQHHRTSDRHCQELFGGFEAGGPRMLPQMIAIPPSLDPDPNLALTLCVTLPLTLSCTLTAGLRRMN